MNQITISRLFTPQEYWLFTRGGACPQDGWQNDETGEPAEPPTLDALVEWETDYGSNAEYDVIDVWPVKVYA